MKHVACPRPKNNRHMIGKFSRKGSLNSVSSFILQPHSVLYCSDDIDCGEQLPVPDKAKPDAVKKLAATALYIHFCNRVCTTKNFKSAFA